MTREYKLELLLQRWIELFIELDDDRPLRKQEDLSYRLEKLFEETENVLDDEDEEEKDWFI